MRPMSCDQLADGVISLLRLEGGRVRQVGEDQREDSRDASRLGHAGPLDGKRNSGPNVAQPSVRTAPHVSQDFRSSRCSCLQKGQSTYAPPWRLAADHWRYSFRTFSRKERGLEQLLGFPRRDSGGRDVQS